MEVPSVSSGGGSQEEGPVEAPKLLGKLPTVVELLFRPSWDGKVMKGKRSVMGFLEGPFVKLLVKVENPPLKMMVQGRTWDDAWAALELALKSSNPPWENDGPPGGKPSKKKK